MGLSEKDIKFSVIASAVRSNLYKKCYDNINENNNTSFEMIFVGNKKPIEKMPNNFQYIYTEVAPVQCFEIAARCSIGEYLIISTDDTLFSPNYLDKINHYLSKLHMEKALVGGRYQTNGIFYDNILTFDRKCSNSPVLPFLSAYKRSVFEELGGFDRRFPYAKFDMDLALRFYEYGYHPFVAPDAWGNEIRNKDICSSLCAPTDRLGLKLCWRFWNDGYKILKNRKLPVESFEDKDILTVDQNNFWNDRKKT
jgi:hypothetical protein